MQIGNPNLNWTLFYQETYCVTHYINNGYLSTKNFSFPPTSTIGIVSVKRDKYSACASMIRLQRSQFPMKITNVKCNEKTGKTNNI